MLPWSTLGLASPETGKACRKRLVGFVQFDLKLSQYTTTFRCLHLHFGMEAFWPQVAEGPKEPGQFIPVWVGHFENRNDSQSLAMVARTVKSLNRHFVATSKLAPLWAEVCAALLITVLHSKGVSGDPQKWSRKLCRTPKERGQKKKRDYVGKIPKWQTPSPSGLYYFQNSSFL